MSEFPFHFQDTYNFCGPACLMMMIESQLESRQMPVTFKLQAEYYNLVRLTCGPQSGCDYFFSSPDGMELVANSQLQSLGILDLTYEVFQPPAGVEPDYFAQIRDTLRAAQAPVFALVDSPLHWVLVYECVDIGGVYYFKVRWPEMKTLSDNPGQVHDGGCSHCGTAGSDDGIPVEEFLRYLLPVSNPNAGKWDGHKIIICPRLTSSPVAAAAPAAAPGASPAPPTNITVQPPPDNTPGGAAESDAAAAPVMAMARQAPPVAPLPPGAISGIVHSLLPHFSQLFKHHGDRLRAEPFVGAPLFVQHLDDVADSYYLVPVYPQAAKGEKLRAPFLLAKIHALTGKLQRVASAAADKSSAGYATPAWVHELEEAGVLDKRLSPIAMKIAGMALTVTPRLVWKRCRESPSPYRPFRVLTDGKQEWLADMHDRVHRELSKEERGG